MGFLLFTLLCQSEGIPGSDPNRPFALKTEYGLNIEVASIGYESSKLRFSCE